MEVHIGKSHSDNFECCIFEYTTERVDNMDIHLTNEYESVEKKDLKAHIVKVHVKEGWINYLKISKNNSSEVYSKL